MELIEVKLGSRFAESINNSVFSERLYFCIKQDGNDIPYGVWHSKFLKNGIIKLLKSLNIYKVIGARDTKRMFIHPKLKLIVDTTSNDNKKVGLTIIDLVNGEYNNIPNFSDLDLTQFNNLPCNDVFSKKHGFGTYIIENLDTGLYKIGRTKNIVKRINDLKKEHGDNLVLIAFKSEDIEAELHELLKYNRFFGEWFNCDLNQILDVINKYEFEFSK